MGPRGTGGSPVLLDEVRQASLGSVRTEAARLSHVSREGLMCACGGRSLLALNPRCHPLVQHIQRHRAAVPNLIVKRADIIPTAESALRLIAKFEDFKLAKLISQRLRRPSDVAVHFRLHAGFIFG